MLAAAISATELFNGAQHSARKAANLESPKKFLQMVKILPFDELAAEEFGLLKQALNNDGKMIGPYDLLIASIVRSKKATLVTHNTKEFSSLKDIPFVDWVR